MCENCDVAAPASVGSAITALAIRNFALKKKKKGKRKTIDEMCEKTTIN